MSNFINLNMWPISLQTGPQSTVKGSHAPPMNDPGTNGMTNTRSSNFDSENKFVMREGSYSSDSFFLSE